MSRIAYYLAHLDRIIEVERTCGALMATDYEAEFEHKFKGKTIKIPNRLGLMAAEIDEKKWHKCVKNGWVVRLGEI